MTGITGIFFKKVFNENLSILDKNKFIDENQIVNDSLRYKNHLFSRNTNKKFLNDKVFGEDSDFIIGLEGVILNLKILKTNNKEAETFSLLKKLFLESGCDFIKELRGEFSGFILRKSDGNLFIFTNQTGSKRIFYFNNADIFIFSSNMSQISSVLKQLNYERKINSLAAYLILTCGFMLESNTYIENIFRLLPGNYLEYNNDQISVKEYFNLKNIEKTTDTKNQIIEKIDELFIKAVKLEYEKDLEYGYEHIATLSGGLDSRMAVLMAHKLGYNSQLNFTFSQSNYLDEKIAKKIATDHLHDFLFISLDGGNFLKDIERNIYINDGLILYSGSAHTLHAIERINFQKFGLVHTGLIGDAVIGSFLSSPNPVKPHFKDGMYSSKLSEKIKDDLELIIERNPTEELYKFYGRGFLGALNGYYYLELVSQGVSPFLDIDFLSYCYSIPEKLKFKQQIYLDWIQFKHKEFANYPWEKTGISPLISNSLIKYFKMGFYQRMSLKLFDKLSGTIRSGMNPMDLWMKENSTIISAIDTFYKENIHRLQNNEALLKDCSHLFETGSANEKMQVITLLGAIKLHDI